MRDTASRGRSKPVANHVTIPSKVQGHISPSVQENNPEASFKNGRAGKRIVKASEENENVYNDVSGSGGGN